MSDILEEGHHIFLRQGSEHPPKVIAVGLLAPRPFVGHEAEKLWDFARLEPDILHRELRQKRHSELPDPGPLHGLLASPEDILQEAQRAALELGEVEAL